MPHTLTPEVVVLQDNVAWLVSTFLWAQVAGSRALCSDPGEEQEHGHPGVDAVPIHTASLQHHPQG